MGKEAVGMGDDMGPTGRRPAPRSLSLWTGLTGAALAFGVSWVVRGRQRSVRVLATALAVATAAEALAIRGAGLLRHHSRPQAGGLPLVVPLGWYAAVTPSYGLAQAAVGQRGLAAVAAVTGLLAVATDLATDPLGLDSGYWEWRDGGSLLREVVGPNGMAGIPAGNYAAWLAISALVAALNEVGRPPGEAAAARRRRTLLLAAYYPVGLGGLWWAARHRRWSLLALAAGATLGGGAAAWREGGREDSWPAP